MVEPRHVRPLVVAVGQFLFFLEPARVVRLMLRGAAAPAALSPHAHSSHHRRFFSRPSTTMSVGLVVVKAMFPIGSSGRPATSRRYGASFAQSDARKSTDKLRVRIFFERRGSRLVAGDRPACMSEGLVDDLPAVG